MTWRIGLFKNVRDLRRTVTVAKIEAVCIGPRAARGYAHRGDAALPTPGLGLLAKPEANFVIAKTIFHD